ncbi:MAG: DUF4157 domain-containing protein [Desulfobacter postgatei]|uniref:eCIS core domain-containing protein n=1 Tax=Desulfobacter postgatei TaxID=2293 RepID=UPI0023F14450|nr:DUF4157 domain-containing protein [Desulfobacter postgatei]MDD4272144.1 DUF4157 domain-containing protein [Desulfobacter postgatei]
MAEMTKTSIAETTSQKSVESTEPKYASVATRQREVNERTPGRRSGIIDKMPSTRMVSLLTDPGVQPNRHQISRGKLAKTLQRRVGNRNTALLLQSAKPREQSEVPESVSTHIEKSRGLGQPLSQSTRAEMESGFGEDFGGVRVHSGTDTERTAETLGAKAYTAGRDVYFGRGGYQPETAQGKHLLAHELAHTVQQRSAPAVPKAKMGVSAPDDPAEQEAESAATAVMKGEPLKHPLKEAQDVTGLLRTEATPVQAAGGTVGASAGPAENGDLVIKLGNDVRIEKSKLEGRQRQIVVDLADAPASLPGLRLNKFLYWPGTKKGELMADVTVPFVSNPRRGLRIQTDKDGVATLSTKTRVPIAALNNPEITLSVGNDHQFTGNVSLSSDKLKPPGLPNLRVDGGGEVEISAGKLKGSVHANLEYAGLAKGKFDASFVDGVPKGSGQVDITQDMLKGAGAAMSIEEGSLKAEVTVPAAKIVPSLPGIEIPSGDLNLTMTNGDLSGGVNNLLIRYKQFGEAGLTGTIRKGVVDGTGTFTLKVPAIDPLTGTFGYRRNKLFGSLTVSAQNIPGGLVQSGSITGRVNDKGQMGFGGSMAVALGSVARGDLKASYDEAGSFGMGADVQLSIPGLQDVNAQVNYVNGALEGDVEIPIASEKLAGLSGNLHVWYKDKRWKGEQKIAYERDNGKLKGDVLLGVAEKVNGGLAVYGGGDVTAQLTSFLQGTLGVKIKEDGTTTLKGAIRVTEPLELFPQKKMDRELFSMSRNIPLWAILVAVIRMRAGVRAGIGPGQLRDITVQGEYTVGGDAPTFDISGELYIPAYVEAYIAFGAGLGLDVLIGSLTGGIEAVGTAGIYGAVSVLPVLSYANGNYTINGTATMAAAAKLKLGLQAWAEVEALWITVWENTWQLAEWVWDVGPTLAIQANMSYTFGQPEPPTLDFKTDNIDAERLIQDAMPKEGPKGSGARDALKNRANWSGRNKGKGKSGDKGGSEVAPKGKATPKAPPKPSRKQKPTGKDADAKRPIKEKGGQRKPGLDKMIDKAAKDKAKAKGKDKAIIPIPSFPAPSAQKIDINWANYLDETRGKGIDNATFSRRMCAGEVFHPKFRDWSTLKNDYKKAYPTLKEHEKKGAYFADKMRGGHYAGSLLRDSSYDPTLETPTPDGVTVPYPIHFPTQFLVNNFENFQVHGGTTIIKQPRAPYVINTGSRKYPYEFGISGTFSNKMAVGTELTRSEPGRSSSGTATEWNKWRNIGFQGGGGTTTTVTAPALSGIVDASMFRKNTKPDGTEVPGDQTFGQFIESDATFSEYQGLRQTDKDQFRADARDGRFSVLNPNHVTQWVSYLKDKAEAETSQRGVSGYEMQHALPLFLIGNSADVPANMWPLSVSQHREGHRILANQPQLKQWGAPTHDLESTRLLGKKFVIKKHGNSL